MNTYLLHKEVQDFLETHYQDEIARITLKGSPFENVTPQELAIQLHGKMKAEKKLPSWFKTRGIIYPPGVNLEQTSSEKTAAYKASLMEGSSLVDVTGGLGIDSFFFAQKFSIVIHCEINRDLQEIAAHNLNLLGAKGISFFQGDGIEFLRKTPEIFDWIYIDPSRRNESGGRVFTLSDCLPNVPGQLNLLLEKGKRIMIKTSPLLDIQAGMQELEKVEEIHVLAIENEVKEVLWVLGRKALADPLIRTMNLRKKGNQIYSSTRSQKSSLQYGQLETYLYEPNAAIMKSGLFENLAHDLSITKLHPNSQLFTSGTLMDFPGRRFRINQCMPYHNKSIRKAVAGQQAHVTIRNFPSSVADIRKKLKIKEGGNRYLFFTTLHNGTKAVLFCEKIKN